MEGADAASAATPAEYEEQGRSRLPAVLRERCGLIVEPGAPPHRLQGEIEAYRDLGVESVEWDFRAFVTVSEVRVPNPRKDDGFIIYPDHAEYTRPRRLGSPRHLSPFKVKSRDGDELGMVVCDYIAIFEMTTSEKWNEARGGKKLLLQRLEERLIVTLERAKSVDASVRSIEDVVAVAGVVGTHSCQKSMVKDVAAFPLLKSLQALARFVFVRQEYSGARGGAGSSGGGGGR